MQVALHVSGKEVALKEFHHEHETDVKGDSKVIILGIQKAGAIPYWEREEFWSCLHDGYKSGAQRCAGWRPNWAV